MGLECEIFMGKEDTDRQALNVYRMELLGAKVNAVTTGTMTLKDAVNEAMREWVSRVDDTHYVLGSVMGPHPFPTIVRDFQAVISKEAREQILEKKENSRKPSWHASAAEAMRWVCSITSSMTKCPPDWMRGSRTRRQHRRDCSNHCNRNTRRLPRYEILLLPG